MACPACGTEITEGLKFCTNCGAPQGAAAPSAAPAAPARWWQRAASALRRPRPRRPVVAWRPRRRPRRPRRWPPPRRRPRLRPLRSRPLTPAAAAARRRSPRRPAPPPPPPPPPPVAAAPPPPPPPPSRTAAPAAGRRGAGATAAAPPPVAEAPAPPPPPPPPPPVAAEAPAPEIVEEPQVDATPQVDGSALVDAEPVIDEEPAAEPEPEPEPEPVVAAEAAPPPPPAAPPPPVAPPPPPVAAPPPPPVTRCPRAVAAACRGAWRPMPPPGAPVAPAAAAPPVVPITTPGPVAIPGDPHAIGAAFGRLGNSQKKAAKTAVGILSVMLEEGELVECVVTGKVNEADGLVLPHHQAAHRAQRPPVGARPHQPRGRPAHVGPGRGGRHHGHHHHRARDAPGGDPEGVRRPARPGARPADPHPRRRRLSPVAACRPGQGSLVW